MKLLQCKDIPDYIFLTAVEMAANIRGHSSASIWDVQAILSGQEKVVGTDMNTWPELWIPEKLVRAKARKLIRKGKLDGCFCGCRGDFEVVNDAK